MKTITNKLCFLTLLLTVAMGRYAAAQSFEADDTKMVITTMAVSGDNIFAGTTNNGVYRSTDSGKVWAPVNGGLGAHEYVLKLAAHEKNVYAVMLSSRSLYVSNNNGDTWTKVTVAPADPRVTSIVTFKNNLYATTTNGLYQSANGSKWEQVASVTDKEAQAIVANDNCMVVQSFSTINTSVFYTTTNGTDWRKIDDNTVRVDHMEIHGSNFVLIWCARSMNNDCSEYKIWVLSKNAKKWEPSDIVARYYGFDGDNIYAVKTQVTDKKNREPEYIREIFKSEDRGRSWRKVEEDKDPFVTTDYNMQQKLAELDISKILEIAEINGYRKGQQLADERRAAAEAEKLKREREWDRQRAATSRSSSSSGSSYNSGKQPDYRALSNDRFNATHNSKSYIDSKGGIHIR